MSEHTRSHLYEETLGVDYTSSVRLELPTPLKKNTILTRLGQLASEWEDPRLPIIGAVVGSGDQKDRSQIILGLDPSRTWGTPTADENELVARRIAEREGWQLIDEMHPKLRVPFGRREGYDATAITHETAAIQERLAALGRTALAFTEADLFSIRHNPENTVQPWIYYEPGVLIEAEEADVKTGVLDDILTLAGETGQDRIVPAVAGKYTKVYTRKERVV
jgi:hypothetical protein